LLVRWNGKGAWAGRLRTDVDTIGPLREQLIDPPARGFVRKVLAAVAEGVGRYIAHSNEGNATDPASPKEHLLEFVAV
jgi:hypothetical protein